MSSSLKSVEASSLRGHAQAMKRLAHLVACTALDALEQTRLHGLNHAIALVIRVIMTQSYGNELRGTRKLLEALLGHDGAVCRAHAAARTMLERIHFCIELRVDRNSQVLSRERLGALATHGSGHAVGDLRLIHDKVTHDREVRQRSHEVLAFLIHQGHARQTRFAVERNGATAAVAPSAAEIEHDRLLSVIDGRNRLKNGHVLVPVNLIVDDVGPLVNGRIVFLNTNLHRTSPLRDGRMAICQG